MQIPFLLNELIFITQFYINRLAVLETKSVNNLFTLRTNKIKIRIKNSDSLSKNIRVEDLITSQLLFLFW